MMANLQSAKTRLGRQSGQTLIIAIIILGILLLLGFAFATIISRNIFEAGYSTRRTVSSDLAAAGAQFAHNQLQQSALGADWRPGATLPAGVDASGYTKDPDALYLRPGSGLPYPGATMVDNGGPDGLGAYARVNFEKGRALIRVRYAPSDIDAFANPTGDLRRPGRARNFLTIESVGRSGAVLTGGRVDPSRLLSIAVKVTNYANAAELASELGRLKAANNQITDSRKLMAFASIGIIESARFITNAHKVTRPAEIGVPTSDGGLPIYAAGIGATYEGQQVSPALQWGGGFAGITVGAGSLWSNASLVIHGVNNVALNADLGDMWAVAGTIKPANRAAELRLTRGYYDRASGSWRYDWGGSSDTVSNPYVVSASAFDTDDNSFSTQGGVIRDRSANPDGQGYSRSIAYKAPPRIDAERYRALTRESGVVLNNRNLGRMGYGRGVYVDSAERGNLSSENERELEGAVKSLPTDWLNPNNTASQGWQGPFYRPVATFLRLTPDGFEIVRDSRSKRPYWRNPSTGLLTNTSRVRFRVREINGQAFILNSVQNPDLVNRLGSSLSDSDFQSAALPFDGVLFFEGDLRVRGVIPTNIQLTVVANGSVYVDGSITKGLVTESGAMLTAPSRSMLMLMAKDYTVLNTTQFFAPGPGEDPKPKNADPLPDTPNPIELDLAESPELSLYVQFLLDPSTATGGNMSAATPYALTYVSNSGGTQLVPNLLLTSSADDGGPAFVSMDIGALTFADAAASALQPYMFATTLSFASAGTMTFNAAANLGWSNSNIPIYGLGNATINAYPKFETVAFPLIGNTSYGSRKLTTTGALGSYSIGVQDETQMRLRLNSAGPAVPKNFLFARAAIAPFDVRIEASMYAEDGSFFVIPGHWMNSNADDTRAAFDSDVSSLGGIEAAQRKRFETYGNTPAVPFYGEPLDVKVTILGAISENMPAPMGQQAEWLRKWGWIPRKLGGTGLDIPRQHIPAGASASDRYYPNLVLNYDPALATATADGSQAIRRDANGWVLPPMPKLPVSSTLAYYGEVNP